MEITPELIANYEFSTSMRGFDADEVNDFLEKVGTELAKAQHQVRKATERIATLEAELANAQTQAANSGNAADVDARPAARALMAAQETADRIEATAAAEAAEVTAAAEREAAALRASIEAEAAAARSSAESEKARIEAEHAELAATLKASALAEADAASGARIAELDEQIGSMTNLSADLQSDVAALQQRVSGYRGLIESMATMFRELLDDEDALYTQPDLELRVAVPPTARPGAVVAPVAAPASDEWERGTWSQDLASEVETPEAEFDDEGEYPLGAETTEVAMVDIDEYVEEEAVDEPTAAHEEVISERDPTLAEGWQNPFDSAEDTVPQPDVWGSAEPVVPVEEESYEPADTWGGRAVEDDVSDFDSHPAASFSDEPSMPWTWPTPPSSTRSTSKLLLATSRRSRYRINCRPSPARSTYFKPRRTFQNRCLAMSRTDTISSLRQWTWPTDRSEADSTTRAMTSTRSGIRPLPMSVTSSISRRRLAAGQLATLMRTRISRTSHSMTALSVSHILAATGTFKCLMMR